MTTLRSAGPVVAVVMLLVLGGCGDSDGGDASSSDAAADDSEPADTAAEDVGSTTSVAETISDPVEVAAIIEAAGLGCTDFAPDPEPEELSDASGGCTLSDGQEVSIASFSSASEVEAFVAFGEEAGCGFFAGQTVPFVVGEYWTISINLEMEDLETDIPVQPTEDLAEAIGAAVDTLDC